MTTIIIHDRPNPEGWVEEYSGGTDTRHFYPRTLRPGHIPTARVEGPLVCSCGLAWPHLPYPYDEGPASWDLTEDSHRN